jgi:hypothetical protein
MPMNWGSIPGDAAAMFAAGSICHADGDQDIGNSRTPAPSDDHRQDCSLCPACHLAATPLLPVPTGAFVLVPRLAYLVRVGLIPPATGPPSWIEHTSRPRGPPYSVA